MRSAFATLSHNSASVNWGCPMRLAALTLVLSTTAAGLSQSPAPASQSPQQDKFSPPSIALSNPALTLSNLPPNVTITSVQRLPKIILPPGQLSLRDGAATLDPKIVVHLPQSSLGAQPSGTLVAQNLYPGLELLPIQDSKPKGEPIPTTWPNAKIEQIPIVWPKAELLPIASSAKGKAPCK